MSALDGLLACGGSWRGTNRLQDPHTNLPEDSSSMATVAPVLAGRFVRIDYTWSYQGKPQEGSLLIGYEAKTSTVTAYWIDTWHMSDKVMVCPGIASEKGELTVLGSYAAPPGPDWGWRISITPDNGKGFRIVMFNIEPGGREYFAVESHYTRVYTG